MKTYLITAALIAAGLGGTHAFATSMPSRTGGGTSIPTPRVTPSPPAPNFRPNYDYLKPAPRSSVQPLPPAPRQAPPTFSGGGFVSPALPDGKGLSVGGFFQTPKGGGSVSGTTAPGLNSVEIQGNRQLTPNTSLSGVGAIINGQPSGSIGVTITGP